MPAKLDNLDYHLRFWDLAVFQILTEARSTTLAAERLGVTQSAVSQSVSRLERSFGTALLDRSKRPLRTTHAGEVLSRDAADILQALQRTQNEVRVGSRSKVPIIRLGLVDSIATTAGPDIIRSLAQSVEQLRVWSGIAPALSSDLLARALDLIVTDDPLTNHPELDRECLFREPLLAAVPRDVVSRFKGQTLADMCAELPLIRPSQRSSFGRAVEYYLAQRRLAVRGPVEFDAGEAMLKTVEAGIGWTIMTPLCLLQAHADALDIAILPLPPPLSYRRVYVLSRPHELVHVTEDVIRICRTCLEGTILPRLRALVPWASTETGMEEVPP